MGRVVSAESYYAEYTKWEAEREAALANLDAKGTTAAEALSQLEQLGSTTISGKTITMPAFMFSLSGASSNFDYSKFNPLVSYEDLEKFIRFCGKQPKDKCYDWASYYGYLVYNQVQMNKTDGPYTPVTIKPTRYLVDTEEELMALLYNESKEGRPVILNVNGQGSDGDSQIAASEERYNLALEKNPDSKLFYTYEADTNRHYVLVPPLVFGDDKNASNVTVRDFMIMDPATPELKPLANTFEGLESTTSTRLPLNAFNNPGNSYPNIKDSKTGKKYEVYVFLPPSSGKDTPQSQLNSVLDNTPGEYYYNPGHFNLPEHLEEEKWTRGYDGVPDQLANATNNSGAIASIVDNGYVFKQYNHFNLNDLRQLVTRTNSPYDMPIPYEEPFPPKKT